MVKWRLSTTLAEVTKTLQGVDIQPNAYDQASFATSFVAQPQKRRARRPA
jgi:hypothetical protein